MKPNALVLLAACLCALPLNTHAQPTKRALIIGISDYPNEGRWRKLHTDLDVQMVRDALTRQGFPPKLIAELRNEKATKQGIINAIEHQLIAPTKPGDIVYFHFSGHGQQVADYSRDEIDTYDEALVPYDAPSAYVEGEYKGEKHLIDDELGALMDRVRAKAGPTGQLIVVIDACHSGTALRSSLSGAAIHARGTYAKLAPHDWEQRSPAGDNPVRERQMEGMDRSAALAPMVSFFASGAGQLNYEVGQDSTSRMGPLSYAFSKHFGDCPPNATYRGLFFMIRDEMYKIRPSSIMQDPEAEGDALDNMVLNGAVIAQAPFFRVVKKIGSDGLRINGGYLQALTKGSVVGFYKSETPEPHKVEPMAKATIEESEPFSSTVSFFGANKYEDAWVYLLEHDPGANMLRVKLDFEKKDIESQWVEALRAEKFIKVDPENFDFILHQEGNFVFIENVFGQKIGNGGGFKAMEHFGAVDALKGYHQARTLRKLGLEKRGSGQAGITGTAEFMLEIFPVVEPVDGSTKLVPKPATDLIDPVTNMVRIPEGTKIKIRIVYRGSRSCYLSLVDLQPDDVLNILAPGDGESPTMYHFSKKGQMLEIPKNGSFTVGPPFGVEMLKLIVTDTPEDLRPALSKTRTRSAAVQSPLQNFFFDTFLPDDLSTRSGSTKVPTEVHISSYTFDIVPR